MHPIVRWCCQTSIKQGSALFSSTFSFCKNHILRPEALPGACLDCGGIAGTGMQRYAAVDIVTASNNRHVAFQVANDLGISIVFSDKY